jgi:NADH dehydrogenase [ubiquinone] 1 alpha subcomplex assembly factor 1
MGFSRGRGQRNYRISMIFDSPSSIQLWRPINDGVMGGVSSSVFRFDPQGFAVFEGQVSLAFGGGFASVRAMTPEFARSNFEGFSLEVWGDGKRYKLNLFTDQSFDGVAYQTEFLPPTGEWATLALPKESFVASFRGRPVAHAPALDGSRIQQVGLMIAGKQAGPFCLKIRKILAK